MTSNWDAQQQHDSRASANPVAAEKKAAPGSAPAPESAVSGAESSARSGEYQQVPAGGEPSPQGGPASAQDAAVVAEATAVEGDLDELVEVAAQRDEYLALAQRTQADFENYRKRMAKEARVAEARGVIKLAKELLPALDNLTRALDAAAPDDPLLEGVRLVHSELVAALARVGIESFSPAGERFDPTEHEAMAQQPVEGAEAGTVVEVYQAGYRLNGTIIRPARVVVAA